VMRTRTRTTRIFHRLRMTMITYPIINTQSGNLRNEAKGAFSISQRGIESCPYGASTSRSPVRIDFREDTSTTIIMTMMTVPFRLSKVG
jgi:hypothetical protein